MSVTVAGKKYHIALMKNDGTQYGFMIVKNSDARQRVNDFAPIYSTGDQQFAEGTWQPIAWNDWAGGVGQEFYSNSQQNKYWYATNCETRIANRLTLGGRWVSTDAAQIATSNAVDFLGNIYIGCGTALRKYNVAGGTWSTVLTAGANIVHLHVDGAFLFIALGSGTDAQKYDGTTFTVLTGIKANAFTSWNGKLWRALANNVFSSTDSGATWSAAVAIDDAAYNINIGALRPYAGVLYACKEDGLYSYDGTNVSRKLNFRNQAYSGNGKYMVEWGGYLFFNILRRVIRFSTTTWNDVTPELTGDSNKELYGWGQPVMFIDMPSMLVCALNGGENSYANLMGYTGQGWHLLYQAAATMYGCGYSRAKDWIIVNNGATRYQAQVAQNDRCSADYEPSGVWYSPWFNGGYPWFKKGGKEVVLETRDCTSTEKVSIAYRTEFGGAWTALGSDVISSTGPTTISLDAANGAIEFYKIQFQLTLARGADTSKRPTVTNFTFRYMNRPSAVYAYNVTVRLSASQRTLVA